MADPSTQPIVIFETVHGSTAYNLNRADSDIDLKGIVVGPREWYFGTDPAPEQLNLTPDHVRFEVRKFIRLAAEANPTVIELLFTDEKHHQTTTASGLQLLNSREVFLSRRIGERFGGYALAQLKRIRTHRSHLLSPPSHMPTRSEFDLPERTVIPADQLAAAESLLLSDEPDAIQAADISPNFLELLYRERRYKTAMKGWQSYQQWLKSRNVKRSELEARFGYDTKHAMHLVRLQRMGIETLRTGSVFVTRPDRDELLAIRDGAWTFDELEEAAERADQALREAALASVLPEAPNEHFLNGLCMEIIERELSC
jgi:uncharacterized protein